MQFLIIARDGRDQDALKRRLAVRERHLENAARLQADGKLLLGGAILDDDGNMVGSAAIADFESRQALDDWLRSDPYVTGNVWQDIEVLPYRVAPHYDIGKKPAESAA